MPFDPNAPDLTVAVVGTGTMGRGIMQVSAQGGMRVMAYDEKPGAAQAAKDYIAKTLGGLVEKGRLPEADAEAAVERISIAKDMAEVGKADVVIEAILEQLEAKQALFAKLETHARPDAILASNTSSIPITAIASKLKHPERVGGMHFFNPVPLMRLVEVIPGLRTAQWVTDAMMVLGKRMTREPVLCTDSPAFLVNHVGRGFVPESQRILTECIASAADIDRILTGAPGFKMGPFALADMVGIDVQHSVMESVFAQFYGEPAFAPMNLSALRSAGGLLGRKTGAGWFTYQDGKAVMPPLAPAPSARPKSVWVFPSPSHADLQAPLIDLFKQAGADVESGDKPSAEALIVATPIGYDVTTAVAELKLDGKRTVAVDVLFGMKGPRTLMVTPATDPAMRDAAHGLLAADGQPVVIINDSPGFVAQRVVAMIVNIGCGVAQRGIATPADIDKATKLGLGYPFGPLEWGDRLCAGRVLFILQRLYAFYGDPRYRPNPWLKRRAMLGLPLSTPEGRSA
jgi:3-hydroxybutyryl-CoA dehydrogenase